MERNWVREICSKKTNSPIEEASNIQFTYIENKETSNKSTKLKEQLEIVTDEIITICYQMEKEVLVKGYISNELLIRFEALNELNSVYKKALGYENPHIIDYPKELIIEYENLKEKVEKIINGTKAQIKILEGVEESKVIVEVLNYRLKSLTILYLHYQRILSVSNITPLFKSGQQSTNFYLS